MEWYGWVPSLAQSAVVAAIVTGVFLIWNRRGSDRARRREARIAAQEISKTELDKRIDARVAAELAAAWARIDEQQVELDKQAGEIRQLRADVNARERVVSAALRVVAALARQWPGDLMPHLDPADIAELEDTEVIPKKWIKPKEA